MMNIIKKDFAYQERQKKERKKLKKKKIIIKENTYEIIQKSDPHF